MKKYFFLILLFSNSLFAFNLDQALDVLDSQNIKIDKNSDLGKNIQKVTDNSVNKINAKIDNFGNQIFKKVEKYEKRISKEIDKLTNIRKSLEQAVFYLKIAAIILALILSIILVAVILSYLKLRKISRKILLSS
jgi:predicted PurR-regulated permease PerM